MNNGNEYRQPGTDIKLVYINNNFKIKNNYHAPLAFLI